MVDTDPHAIGINSAAENFQIEMQKFMSVLKQVELLADDILIYGSGDNDNEAFVDHNRNLERLLTRLQRMNCKLNRKKMKLFQHEVKFYGHIISA